MTFSLPYKDDLTPEERKQFTERLLTLHQVLGESADENYGHSFIIKHFGNDGRYGYLKEVMPHLATNTCGTAACAVGHAVWQHHRFPGLPIWFSDDGKTPLGLAYPNGESDSEITDAYFGPGAWRYIFDTGAYLSEHNTDANGVTRSMAMKRIEDFVTQRLGCKLIE